MKVQSFFLVGYIVYEKMENAEKRKPAAPAKSVYFNWRVGVDENWSTARSSPARVAG